MPVTASAAAMCSSSIGVPASAQHSATDCPDAGHIARADGEERFAAGGRGCCVSDPMFLT
jgi:hypothetical protein